VRIGVHSADANRRGTDYSGVGVHLASRVAALGRGGEIVVTRQALDETPDVTATDPREAELKGVAAPVAVATVSWS
jgi:class 3 adenylate cyclase